VGGEACHIIQRPCEPPLSLFFQNNHVVRQVSSGGTISTVAGIATAGYSGEGLPALSSKLSSPTSICPYNGGYAIVSRGVCRIMGLWPNATLSTIAGSGTCGLAGDGGLATLALIAPNWGVVAADPAGPGGGLVFGDQVRGGSAKACCLKSFNWS
jgi:hypothetical protein